MNPVCLPFSLTGPGPTAMTEGKKASGLVEGSHCSSLHDEDLFTAGESPVQFFHAGQMAHSPVFSMKEASELLDAPFQVSSFTIGRPVYSSPCPGPDGTVYVSSYDGALSAIQEGKKIWEFKTEDSVYSSPCLGPDGTVYVSSNDSRLYAIQDGKRLWDVETKSYSCSRPCVGPDGTVYASSYDGSLYAIKEGLKSRIFEAKGGMYSPCLGPDGTVYVCSDEHRLYAFNEGRMLLNVEIPGHVESSPCLGPDGTVYVGSDNGKVYGISFAEDRLMKGNESEPDTTEAGSLLETDDEWLTIDGFRLRINQRTWGSAHLFLR